MRRISLRLIIALITFTFGVTAVTVWYFKTPKLSRAEQEDQIAELAFRNRIQVDSNKVFFLSREEETDPSDEFMQRFESTGKLRVRKLSQAIKGAYEVTDRETGAHGVILQINGITWINENEAKVGISEMGRRGWICRAVREKGAWIVKDCEISFET